MSKKTPWQRILHAAEANRGVRLTAHEVLRLSCDNAIKLRAELDDLLALTDRRAARHRKSHPDHDVRISEVDGYSEAVCHTCSWSYDPNDPEAGR